MQKTDDKVGNKTANKERKKESERERSKKSKFWLLCIREKTKKLFNYVRLVAENMSFFLAKLVFSHNYAN